MLSHVGQKKVSIFFLVDKWTEWNISCNLIGSKQNFPIQLLDIFLLQEQYLGESQFICNFFFSVMMKLANEKTHKLGYYQVENKTNDELLLRKLLKQFNITWIKGTRVSTQTLWHFYWQLQVSCMICHTNHLFEPITSIVASSKTHTSNVCNSFDTYM